VTNRSNSSTRRVSRSISWRAASKSLATRLPDSPDSVRNCLGMTGTGCGLLRAVFFSVTMTLFSLRVAFKAIIARQRYASVTELAAYRLSKRLRDPVREKPLVQIAPSHT